MVPVIITVMGENVAPGIFSSEQTKEYVPENVPACVVSQNSETVHPILRLRFEKRPKRAGENAVIPGETDRIQIELRSVASSLHQVENVER